MATDQAGNENTFGHVWNNFLVGHFCFLVYVQIQPMRCHALINELSRCCDIYMSPYIPLGSTVIKQIQVERDRESRWRLLDNSLSPEMMLLLYHQLVSSVSTEQI